MWIPIGGGMRVNIMRLKQFINLANSSARGVKKFNNSTAGERRAGHVLQCMVSAIFALTLMMRAARLLIGICYYGQLMVKPRWKVWPRPGSVVQPKLSAGMMGKGDGSARAENSSTFLKAVSN